MGLDRKVSAGVELGRILIGVGEICKIFGGICVKFKLGIVQIFCQGSQD